ncbi:MAG TPA: DegT/DnrJ/EryC1/StrS family aminotransferase [Candidatus Nitrosopelagicus sp.]|nr:DegT/DnrJ/EryC1/StrS family aminotransferase [Candidatus Nitrosopelagicus sp.]
MTTYPFIPVNSPLLDGNEKKYLNECIDTGWISSEGQFVNQFEDQFAKRLGRNHAIAVTSGTAALDVAIEALLIGPGDEVILPAFTIISCISQIIRSGAIPVLVDSDPLTWNMNLQQIEEKITERTKAILVVHIFGLPVDLDPILELAKKNDIKIIEDAAEMHGQTYNGNPCGSFGDISTFSFYPNKHITTGEGGMIVTNDAQLAEDCRSLRNLCFQPEKRFVHERFGWNYRMTNIQAALGLAQLERLDEFVERKRIMGKKYTQGLRVLNEVQLPLEKTDYAENIYWVFGVVLDDSIGFDAEEAMKMLEEKGIGCRPFFCPMNQQPVLRKMGFFIDESYPVAERLYKQGFYIPSGVALNSEQINHVTNKLIEVLK